MLQPFDFTDDLANWSSLAPDDTASAELSVEMGTGRSSDGSSVTISTTSAIDHRSIATFDFVDLGAFEDIQFWVRSSATSDSSLGYVAELSLGATNLGLDAPSNTWRRYLPIRQADQWELVIVSIADVHDRVRSRCNQMQLRILKARSLTIEMTQVAAIRETPIADADAALFGLLNDALDIDDVPVPAVLAPDAAPGDLAPHFLIRPLSAGLNNEQARSAERRTDFTDHGFLSRPAFSPFDLDYAVDLVASSRAEQQQMADFLLHRVPPTGYIEVNQAPTPFAWNGALISRGDAVVPSAPLRVTLAYPYPFERTHSTRPFTQVVVAVNQP